MGKYVTHAKKILEKAKALEEATKEEKAASRLSSDDEAIYVKAYDKLREAELSLLDSLHKLGEMVE